MKRLGRERAQNSLDTFRAMAVSQAKTEDRKPWIDEQETLAGYRNNG